MTALSLSCHRVKRRFYVVNAGKVPDMHAGLELSRLIARITTNHNRACVLKRSLIERECLVLQWCMNSGTATAQ
jgi:hypothetical protein